MRILSDTVSRDSHEGGIRMDDIQWDRVSLLRVQGGRMKADALLFRRRGHRRSRRRYRCCRLSGHRVTSIDRNERTRLAERFDGRGS